MNELDRLIFDDFILCFFKCQRYLNKENWRELFLVRFIEVFPENEVCDDIRQVSKPLECGCCHGNEYLIANYIKEIN